MMRMSDGLFVHIETQNALQSISGTSFPGGAGMVWTVYELACVLSPLVVDVVLPVLVQRQALAVPFVLTVEVPQIQFFDVVGVRFLHMWVHIDQSLMCPWSCRGRYRLLSSVSRGRGRIPHISNARSRAIRTWILGFFHLLLVSGWHSVPGFWTFFHQPLASDRHFDAVSALLEKSFSRV